MSLWVVLVVAVLLSLERLCYVWIGRAPNAFCAWCDRPFVVDYVGKPVDVVRKLFYGFKAIQFAVFIGWCYVYGHGAFIPLSGSAWSLGLGGVLLVSGQVLNVSVFYRLGTIGIFYGHELGYEIPWCRGFPFSLCKHPQYVGTVLSIWGFFLVMRFPHDDWYIIPLLETVFYILGAYVEP